MRPLGERLSDDCDGPRMFARNVQKANRREYRPWATARPGGYRKGPFHRIAESMGWPLEPIEQPVSSRGARGRDQFIRFLTTPPSPSSVTHMTNAFNYLFLFFYSGKIDGSVEFLRGIVLPFFIVDNTKGLEGM